MNTPTFEEFNAHATHIIRDKFTDNPDVYSDYILAKYECWKEAGWKKELKGKLYEIKNWKNTLLQTLLYREPNKVKKIEVQKAEVVSTGKMSEIENELIVTAYNYYKREGKLELVHEEVFSFLYDRGIFKAPDELGANKKTWANWYNKMKFKAVERTKKVIYGKPKEQYLKELEQIKEGTHPDLWRYGKLECLKAWFKPIKTKEELITKINR